MIAKHFHLSRSISSRQLLTYGFERFGHGKRGFSQSCRLEGSGERSNLMTASSDASSSQAWDRLTTAPLTRSSPDAALYVGWVERYPSSQFARCRIRLLAARGDVTGIAARQPSSLKTWDSKGLGFQRLEIQTLGVQKLAPRRRAIPRADAPARLPRTPRTRPG
jgi:hypothetical protein